MLDWDDLRVFEVLARTGSLSGAARALKVNHATIGRRVAALEAELGVTLVTRLPRNTILTPQGEAIAALAREMEQTAQAVTRRARAFENDLTGNVRISLPPALASDFLAERLTGFSTLYPGLTVTLKATPMMSSLERGETDLAIRLVRPDGPAQVARRLGVMQLGLYAAPSVATTSPKHWRFVLADDDLAHLPHQVWLANYADGRPVSMQSSDIHTQINAVRAGLGVAALPVFMTGHTDLVRVDVGVAAPARGIWLVVHEEVRKAPAVQATMAWLAETFAASEFRAPIDFDWSTAR